ncbi:MAG: class I SAM-dependent methyltransferase [Solirubrobacteraceae bacterium]
MTKQAAAGSQASRGRLGALARRALAPLVRPYARRRAREAALQGAVARLEAELERVGERHTEQIERLEGFVRELVATSESLRRGVSDADATASWARQAVEPIAAELYALPYMADSPFETMSSPVGEVLGYRTPRPTAHGSSDSRYAAFEDLFRGPSERVQEAQRPYLELVRDHAPVLDVGCGRGELLSLLAGEGIAATGVDADPGMVARCTALGLQATLGDVNEHLEGLQDSSLGTIFCAQVIEHLPHAELQRMLELSLRKLRPGGLFIAETVNPHRISSMKTFWVDLTHQHPIFPEVALAVCAIAGFESAYVFAPTFDSFERARFKAPAYAVVATAPAQAPR